VLGRKSGILIHSIKEVYKMLDDLKLIHERDGQDALGIAQKQWQQLSHDFAIVGKLPAGQIDNVVLSGMGGSALAALLFNSWPGLNVPFEVSRNYSLPGFVGANTLVIASSYSGNTEETLQSLQQAASLGAKIFILAGGGKLIDIAKEKNYPYILLPPAGQPRFAALYGLNALVTLFTQLKLLPPSKLAELKGCVKFLKETTAKWAPGVATPENYAKQLAYEVMGNSPVIYSGPLLFPAAYKWKISFNENAKNIAWCNQYPEFNHNEFLGWVSHPIEKPYKIIDLRTSFDHPQVAKRFIVSDKLLSGRRPAAISVNATGGTPLQHILWVVALGDFVSLYTAILNGINPTPVDLIEKFKKEISK
jgi:glucose/mannose-6-phosphate isomerase